MTKLTRRSFLQKLGAAGILGALYNLDTLTLSSTLAHAAGEDYRALVCVFLFGGNDGNNTIIPASGGGYAGVLGDSPGFGDSCTESCPVGVRGWRHRLRSAPATRAPGRHLGWRGNGGSA